MAQAQATGTPKVKKAKVTKRTFRVTGNPDDGYQVECLVGKTVSVTLDMATMPEVERFLTKQFMAAHAPVTVHVA